jgi:hypothetical protein
MLVPAGISSGWTTDAGSLQDGYRLLYSFRFPAAGQAFAEWRVRHPDSPLGPLSQAANLLVGELDRLGILQAQFFLDDSSFTSGGGLAPGAGVRERFETALSDTEWLARQRLRGDERNRDALFAMALACGLKADYAALIDGRSLASLSYTRDGARWAARLQAVAPDDGDAWLSTGISDYIVGSLSPPIRWLLRLGGFTGDKRRGVRQLQLTAQRGELLAPLARILLAVTCLRDGNRAGARQILVGLSRDFPENPLFPREILRIDRGR